MFVSEQEALICKVFLSF